MISIIDSSDSGEDDYMSDKFLSQCVKKDLRPGLVKNRSQQREVQIAAKKRKFDDENKKTQPKEKDRLQEGLGTSISEDNKGFKLLAKMGYKKGQALGKDSSGGIVEPVTISIKSDRMGLGREAAIREFNAKKQELRRKKFLEKSNVPQVSFEEHRKRMMQKAKGSSIERNLRRLQITCEKLDLENNIDAPEASWFWPMKLGDANDDSNEEEEDNDEIEYEPIEKLEMLSMYLRTTYNYCYWCGTQYHDADDLISNCPGPGEDDH